MDIREQLQTIDGNYLSILLFLLPILTTLVVKAFNMRKNQKNILSVIDNCKNRVALNQFEDALDEYENILKTYKLSPYNKGFILYDMGYIYYQISLTRDKEENLKQELYCYHMIINLFPDIGSLRWRILNKEKKKLIGYTMNGLARAQNDMATIRESEEFTNASIEVSIISERINRKYNQKHQIAIAYSNLAVSYRSKYDISNNQNDFEKALKYNKWSLSLLKSMNKKSEIARIENNLGNLLMQKGILEKEEDSINEGISYLENSKKTYTIKDFPYEYARACMNPYVLGWLS